MTAPAHAILGASSASRWINCPGSVREIAKLPKRDRNRTTVYADEGTSAHSLCERCLREGTNADKYFGKTLKGELGSYEVNDEMVEAVQMYLDEIRRQTKRLGPTSDILIEERVHPVPEDTELFGTADAIVADEMIHSELVVTDFKYGAGVVVDVDFNDQAMYYALGALRLYPEIETVKLVIVQPRAHHFEGPIRRVALSRGDLLAFGDILVGAAARTMDPAAPLNPGDHCGFCPVKKAGRCPALNALAVTTVKSDFADLLVHGVEVADDGMPANLPAPSDVVIMPDVEDLEALSKAWLLIPYLDHYIKGVQEAVRRRVEFGREFPWAKMVRKKANRVYTNPETIEATAIKEARRQKKKKSDIFTDPTLLSVAQLEKILGKDFIAEHAEKPEGGLTLASMNDKRLQIKIALPLEDFDDVPELTEGKAPTAE